MEGDDDLTSYTPPQVAMILGVGEGTVRREIRRGLLDAWKPGSKDWRVTRRALSAYVERKEEENRETAAALDWTRR